MVKLVRVLGPAALVLVAFLALVAALSFGGGAKPTLIDPGAFVRWGLPVAKLLMNLGVAVTIGSLALAVFALSDRRPEYGRALDIAAAGAALWAVAGGVAAMLTFSNLANIPFALDDSYGQVLGQYLTANEIGRAWLTTVLLGAVITVLCFAVRNQTLVALIGILSILAVLPLAQQGHAGSRASHDVAITAIFLHIAAASAWLGGLVTVVLMRGQLDASGPGARTSRLARVLPRYSTLALLAFIVVAASGYVSAAVRIGELPSVLSPYGILVLVKVAALGALGLFGVFYRRILIERIVSGGPARLFWLLAVAELAFMGLASGVAAALARTATPVDLAAAADQPDPTPAYILTDAPLPPELNATTWFTQWNLDLLWLLVAGFGIIFYLAGVRRLRRRGDRWPWYRAVLWIAGMLLLIWVTNGPINVYEKYLFSIHMLGHMLLGMAIPVLLVLSAPVTLALRTVRKRDDGSRGVREWLLLAVHSRVAAVVTHPLVVAALFAGSLWVFYYTPLFRWATTDHVGHTWMIIHFLITGYLFAQTLVGIDPIPNQPPFPLRLVLLLATMAAHAFFGLSFVTGTTLLLPDWYGAMGRTWGPTPLADQQAGGGIAWSVGEIPTVILAITVALLWSRSDARDARRRDRAADRDGDAELRAYNEMLARQAGEGR